MAARDLPAQTLLSVGVFAAWDFSIGVSLLEQLLFLSVEGLGTLDVRTKLRSIS